MNSASNHFLKSKITIECNQCMQSVTIKSRLSNMLYMSSSFWLLGVTDFSQAEKERTAGKPEQIHKMTTIFTQNDPRLSF